MRMVLKFGGSSLASPQLICQAAKIGAAMAKQGNQVVIVVSAQGDTTDEMIQQTKAFSPCPEPREMDAYLTAGEQMSAALMAMALLELRTPAVSFTGFQAGIHTDSCFGCARIQSVCPAKIQEALDAGKVAVVAGFQGVDCDGNLTTLGRGGSDTTAVALAAALHADICRIYTDVDGVYDRDPGNAPMPAGSGASAITGCWPCPVGELRCFMTGAWNWPGTITSGWRFAPPLPTPPAPSWDNINILTPGGTSMLFVWKNSPGINCAYELYSAMCLSVSPSKQINCNPEAS